MFSRPSSPCAAVKALAMTAELKLSASWESLPNEGETK